MNRLLFLTGLLLASPAAALAADAPARPNLVLVFADDFGYGDPGCYGGTLVPTPAIDSLARDGVRCTDGYATAPVCAPSRCGLMSGAYNQRFGMQWNDDRRKYSFGQHQLLPQALRAAGYVTGHIGKWNLPVDAKECFDEVYDLIDWEADYFPDASGHYYGVDSETEFASSKRQGVWGPERPGEEYLTDRIGRHAVEFVEKHQRGGKPFFLYLAFNAVHTPLHAKKEDADRFGKLPIPLNFYAAMVASMDENLGRVLAALPANTLVAFTSDNGPARMPVEKWPEGWPQGTLNGSAGPLNGHKGQFLDGGFREPYLLRWPGKLAAGQRLPPARQHDGPVPDVLRRRRRPGAGRHQARWREPAALPDRRANRRPHEILFWKNGENGAVREGDWKLLLSPWQPKRQLFNLADDIGEKRDLAGDQPELVERLHKAWLDWSGKLPPRANPVAAKPSARQAPGSCHETAARSRRPVLAERQEPRRQAQSRRIPRQPSRPGSREDAVRQVGHRQRRCPQPRRIYPYGSQVVGLPGRTA